MLASRSRTSRELRDVVQTVNAKPLRDEAGTAQTRKVRVERRVARAALGVLPLLEGGGVPARVLDVGGRVLGAAEVDRTVHVTGLTRLAIGVALRVYGRAAQ